MKKFTIILIFFVQFLHLFVYENPQSLQSSKNFSIRNSNRILNTFRDREKDPPPEYSFILNGDGEPTTWLYSSWWDYMPFGFNGHSIRIQPEVSSPYDYLAGGIYISYICSETSAILTNRRAWFSYLDSDQNLFTSHTVNSMYGIFYEGFASLDIDNITCDPFFSWHTIMEEDCTTDCLMSYDNFHLTGSTGYWKQPWIVIDNPELSEPFTGYADDEYIDPIVWIGDSPLEDHSRVHIYANNVTNSNKNILYGYADFNAEDLLYESEFDWTYTTFPELDDIAYNRNIRINKDMIANEYGQVAFFGSYDDTLFCLYSNDWGNNFNMHKQEWLYEVENPLREDGSTYEFYDDDGITPSELVFCLSNDGTHYNGVFSDDNTKILWMSGININTQENREQEIYMAAYFYPKIFTFDIQTEIFSFYDIDINGINPGDEQPAIPWDLDEDGFVDEYYDDGSVYIPLSMPSWFFNSDQGYQDAFLHENNFKISANNNWIAAVWHDSKKLRRAYFEEEGYDGWIQQPEIAISISGDSGETWSEIRYINANPLDSEIDPENYFEGNFAPEFAEMLPIDITLGEKLEIISNSSDNYQAKLHIAFLDDNDYGSAAGSSEGGGDLTGGALRYAALELEFQEPWIEPAYVEDPVINVSSGRLTGNYPNPFNPETVIKYQLLEDSFVMIDIYNLKGQYVRSLVKENVIAGGHQVIWNGRDENNNSVSSGIYFCRLRTKENSDMRKMMLLK